MENELKDTDVLEITKSELDSMIAKSVADSVKSEVEKASIEIMKSQKPQIAVGDSRDKKVAFGSFLQAFGKTALETSSMRDMKLVFEAGQPTKSENWQTVSKAMNTGDLSAGGNMINQIGSEYVNNLYSQSVVRQAGARVIDDPKGQYEIDKSTAQPTAYWKGETESANATSVETGTINMATKQLIAVIPVSNRLLRSASYNIAQVLQEDLAGAAAQAEDLAFIAGTGTNRTPKGIVGWTAPGNQFNSTGTTLATTITDFSKARGLVAKADIPVSNPALLVNPRVMAGLTGLTDGNSNAWFMQYLNQGQFAGYRIYESNNVPIYNSGSNYAYTIFAMMGQMRILQSLNLSLEFIPNATYNAANGDLVSGVSQDVSVFRLTHEVDFAQVHSKAAAIIKQHTLGA
jgi:HK97 family phage major capsid protein